PSVGANSVSTLRVTSLWYGWGTSGGRLVSPNNGGGTAGPPRTPQAPRRRAARTRLARRGDMGTPAVCGAHYRGSRRPRPERALPLHQIPVRRRAFLNVARGVLADEVRQVTRLQARARPDGTHVRCRDRLAFLQRFHEIERAAELQRRGFG